MIGPMLATICTITGACTEETSPYPRVSEDAYESRLPFFDPGRNSGAFRITREHQDSKSTYREFVFRGALGQLVPGTMEIPITESSGAVPLILLLHYWTGSQLNWWKDGNRFSTGEMRKALLDAGYAVLALDAPMHGKRQHQTDFIDLDSDESYFSLNEVVFLSVKDCRRILDYVDCEHKKLKIDRDRYGVLGYSMGGVSAFCLLAVEPRIKFAVTCVPPLVFEEYGSTKPVDYTWGVKGKPILLLMGKEDDETFYKVPEATVTYKAYIESPYSKLIWYDSSHQLPSKYVTDAINWLRHQK